MGKTLDCANCPDRCPDVRPGNYEVMHLYSLASNCVRYVSTMEKPFISGLNWADIESVARMANISITPILLKRLREIESLVIKESIENVSH